MMMRICDYRSAVLSVSFLLLLAGTPSLLAQAPPAHSSIVQLDHVTSSTPLLNGIDLRDGDARMQIIALREDVVRIRVSRSKDFAEDASWAVLKEARESRVAVTSTNTTDAVGFQTKVLRVSIKKQTFALTVSDLDGNILQQDVRPTEFHGDSFRIYKEMHEQARTEARKLRVDRGETYDSETEDVGEEIPETELHVATGDYDLQPHVEE